MLTFTKGFTESMWSPEERMYPHGKQVFLQITVGPYCQEHPAVVGEILVSSRLIAIFTGQKSR
jgi:hypothetical protein